MFCMKVENMGAHNATAATSGMFLVYCDCTTKTSPAKLQIVAAVTVGEIGNLIVGKNAIYYDNKGLVWDAVITKINSLMAERGEGLLIAFVYVSAQIEPTEHIEKRMVRLLDKIGEAL